MSILEQHNIGKVCAGCHERLPLAQFGFDRRMAGGRGGHIARCKRCVYDAAKAYKANKAAEVVQQPTRHLALGLYAKW